MTDAAIVTGASSGLGLEIARLLAARGLEVVGVSRRESPFTVVRGDAARAETARAAIEAARSRGALRLLVNCAGVGIYGPAGSYDEEAVRRIIDANLVATIVFCDAVFPLMREQGGGKPLRCETRALRMGTQPSQSRRRDRLRLPAAPHSPALRRGRAHRRRDPRLLTDIRGRSRSPEALAADRPEADCWAGWKAAPRPGSSAARTSPRGRGRRLRQSSAAPTP